MPTFTPTTRREKRLARWPFVLLSLLLLTANIGTLALLFRTGEALQQAQLQLQQQAEALQAATANIPQNSLNLQTEPVEEEASMPVSAMLDYAERDGVSIEFLQRFFDDRIILWDDEEKLRSIPVDESLKPSNFSQKNIVVDENTGLRHYEVDGERISLVGIDVSSHQGWIDWNRVKAAGVDYAILRAAYRGYVNGALRTDTTFAANLRGALDAGVPVGAYVYSQAITEAEAIEEADLVLDAIRGYDVTYPIVFDMEEVNDSDVRTAHLTPAERTDITIAFCERVRQAGYTPMVYGNIRWMAIHLDLSRLESYDKWFAQYFKQPFFPYEFAMWQYTGRGRIAGVNGDVDLNMGFVDYAARAAQQAR